MLRELGRLAREEAEADEARFDERWDRLAAGTLTAEEEAELEALAASSPEGKEAFEAFRPLGADFQAQMVAKVRAELASPARNEVPVPPVHLLFFRRAVRQVEIWVGPAAALAAGVVFLVHVLALPTYSIDSLHGDQTIRGTQSTPESGIPVFGRDSPLTLVARPAHPVTTPVEAVAFLAHGGELMAWQRGERGPGGSFRFVGNLSRCQPGDWKAWVVIGRSGRIPSASELEGLLREGRTEGLGWQAISKDLRIATRASP